MCSTSQAKPADLVKALMQPSSYPDDEPVDHIELCETHISWVFLTNQHAYKVKKPIVNAFVDYSTLENRKTYCEKEVEFDRRYAADLYLAVVPIFRHGSGLVVGGSGDGIGAGSGTVVEYAVKMRRFEPQALLSQRLLDGQVGCRDITGLAQTTADMHRSASVADSGTTYGNPQRIFDDALHNLDALDHSLEYDALGYKPLRCGEDEALALRELRQWTRVEFERRKGVMNARKKDGWVRACHGDLHSGNVVYLDGRLVPFDGIEFNEGLRWIDTMSDLAFLSMDLRFHQASDLAHALISCYLEEIGDYAGLELLPWYTVYRALVRAKVACMELTQHPADSADFRSAMTRRADLLRFAHACTKRSEPELWITHGPSGSGKSTRAQDIVLSQGAIRLRADVERKRLAGMQVRQRPTRSQADQLYSSDMGRKTYQRLYELAEVLLGLGVSVIVDATFLKRDLRQRFAGLAQQFSIPLQILECSTDRATLESRLRQRGRDGTDPSDADLSVLETQLATQEPLTIEEQAWVVAVR